MDKVYVFEGKTSTEAIEKGLKELNVSKNKVNIKILEQEDKRSFFSILAPRVVKVEMTLKDDATISNKKESVKREVKRVNLENIDMNEIENNLKSFMEEFIQKLPSNDLSYKIETNENIIKVDIDGDYTGYLIGYRGEVLNSIQTIMNNIVAKNCKEKIKVIVNIGGYREKREKDLQVLATKIAATVEKTKKSITLEPMPAYERKVIHTKLQENNNIKTYSIGEEPYRKVVVSMK